MIPYTCKELLQEEYDNDEVEEVHNEITGTFRWGTTHEAVFKWQDRYWLVSYRYQPEEGVYWWELDEKPTEVKRVERIVTSVEYVNI